jgi:hypothetical protein
MKMEAIPFGLLQLIKDVINYLSMNFEVGW